MAIELCRPRGSADRHSPSGIHVMKVRTTVTAAVLIGAASMAHATVHDHIFGNHFDTISDLPANSNAASRFLTQATFGPTAADIARVMQVGYGEWIDEQLGMPATVGESTVESIVNKRTAAAQNSGMTQRLNRWWWQATYAPDQLRQRMAFALGQILVVSDQSSAVGGDVIPMTSYQDLLATDSFLAYRTLLEDVTYSPTMGRFLNAYHNIKANCTGTNPVVCTTSPDENYAREIMQLFSVGLVKLDLQGNTVLTGGVATPTYDQSVITATAKVFTGLTYSDAPLGDPNNNYAGANFYGGGSTFVGQYSRMACWGLELFPYTSGNMKHDITGDDNTLTTPKTVIDGNQLAPVRECGDDIGDLLGILAGKYQADGKTIVTPYNGHQNVPPFVSRQLIQRFITSNPSPQYIGRVTAVWESSGGDLGDVMKAILTDAEARTAPAIGAVEEGDRYGKLREPILRVTALWRAFSAQAQPKDVYGEIPMTGGGISLGNFGQNTLESPTVFNFYTPDYAQPGVFSDNDLVSPEFQITNESIIYLTINTFYNLTKGAYVGMSGPPTDRPLIDLSTLVSTLGTVSTPTSESATVDLINTRLMYGSMTSSMHDKLVSMIHTGMNGATVQERAWSLVYITMLSPEFATQR